MKVWSSWTEQHALTCLDRCDPEENVRIMLGSWTDYAPAVMFHNLRRYLTAAELGLRIYAVSNFALKS